MKKRPKKHIFYGICCFITAILVSALMSCPIEKPNAVSVGGFCSGFVVEDNFVMTAKHCTNHIKIGDHIKIYIQDQMRDFVLKYRSNLVDAALLYGPTNGLKKLNFSKDVPIYAEKCTAYGYPSRAPRQIHINLETLFWRGNDIFFKGAAYFGFSGSPILNEKKEVVAILVRGNFFFTIGVAAPYLQDFVKGVKNGEYF